MEKNNKEFVKIVKIGKEEFTIKAVGMWREDGQHVDLVKEFLKPFGITAIRKDSL